MTTETNIDKEHTKRAWKELTHRIADEIVAERLKDEVRTTDNEETEGQRQAFAAAARKALAAVIELLDTNAYFGQPAERALDDALVRIILEVGELQDSNWTGTRT
jgi:hypothetical protein